MVAAEIGWRHRLVSAFEVGPGSPSPPLPLVFDNGRFRRFRQTGGSELPAPGSARRVALGELVAVGFPVGPTPELETGAAPDDDRAFALAQIGPFAQMARNGKSIRLVGTDEFA